MYCGLHLKYETMKCYFLIKRPVWACILNVIFFNDMFCFCTLFVFLLLLLSWSNKCFNAKTTRAYLSIIFKECARLYLLSIMRILKPRYPTSVSNYNSQELYCSWAGFHNNLIRLKFNPKYIMQVHTYFRQNIHQR